MAEQDRNPETSIIGRDADAARRTTDGAAVANQLSETTSEDAGGNVSGTGDENPCEGLDIVFEFEGEDTEH